MTLVIPESKQMNIGESLFVTFMHDVISQNNAPIFRRIVKVSSMDPREVLLKLRTVSKNFSDNCELARLLSSFSCLALTLPSVEILKNSVLWRCYDAVRCYWSDTNLKKFMQLMEMRIESGAPQLKSIEFFPNGYILSDLSFVDSLDRLSEGELSRYFSGIENISWNTILSSMMGDADFAERSLNARLLLNGKRKHIEVTSDFEDISSDADLIQIFASVKSLCFRDDHYRGHVSVETCIRVLKNCPSLVSLEANIDGWFCDAIKLMSDDDLLACFKHLRSITLSANNTIENPEEVKAGLKRLLMLPDFLHQIDVSGVSLDDFMSSFSDAELLSIFGSVRSLRMGGVAPELLARILLSMNSLRAWGCPSEELFSDEVAKLPEEDRRRIFKRLKQLPPVSYSMPSEDTMMVVLSSMSSLRDMALPISAKLSDMIMDMSDEDMSQLFGKLRELQIDDFGMTQGAFLKIMRFSKNLNNLYIHQKVQGDAETRSDVIIDLIKNSTDEQLVNLFASLQSIYIDSIDFSENFEEFRRYLEATVSLERVIFEHGVKIDFTEQQLRLLSEKALFHLAQNEEHLLCNPQIRAQLLKAAPRRINEVFSYDRYIEHAVNLSDDEFKAFFDGLRSLRHLEVHTNTYNDVFFYRLLKLTTSLEELFASDLEDISALIDNLCNEELRHGFRSLSTFELDDEVITVYSLERLLKACTSLSNIGLGGCDQVSKAIQNFSDKELDSAFGNVMKLDLSKTNVTAKALERILKSTPILDRVNLENCTEFSQVIAALSDQELRSIFGKVRRLDISHTNLSVIALFRLLSVLESVNELNLEGCKSIYKALQNFNDRQFVAAFSKLSYINLKETHSDVQVLGERFSRLLPHVNVN